jgi:uncharacterized protein YcaQ
MPISFDDLRRFAVARSLFPPTTLKRALHHMGFVQADPIRAPARAQDLILRHRVKGYRAGDLERRYAELDIHEDFFINYGFVTRELQSLMRSGSSARGRSSFRSRFGQELLGRIIERNYAPAGRDALSRLAASSRTHCGDSVVCGAPARSRTK